MQKNRLSKKKLEGYRFIKLEIARLADQIEELKGDSTVSLIQQSSHSIPYQLKTSSVTGPAEPCPTNRERIYKKMGELRKWQQEMTLIEEMVDDIEDLKVRQIAYLRYIKGEKWQEVVAHFGHWESEDTLRKSLYRHVD